VILFTTYPIFIVGMKSIGDWGFGFASWTILLDYGHFQTQPNQMTAVGTVEIVELNSQLMAKKIRTSTIKDILLLDLGQCVG
jgi:hypothetical protein